MKEYGDTSFLLSFDRPQRAAAIHAGLTVAPSRPTQGLAAAGQLPSAMRRHFLPPLSLTAGWPRRTGGPSRNGHFCVAIATQKWPLGIEAAGTA